MSAGLWKWVDDPTGPVVPIGDVRVRRDSVLAVRSGRRKGGQYIYDEIEVRTLAGNFWVDYPTGTNSIEKRTDALDRLTAALWPAGSSVHTGESPGSVLGSQTP